MLRPGFLFSFSFVASDSFFPLLSSPQPICIFFSILFLSWILLKMGDMHILQICHLEYRCSHFSIFRLLRTIPLWHVSHLHTLWDSSKKNVKHQRTEMCWGIKCDMMYTYGACEGQNPHLEYSSVLYSMFHSQPISTSGEFRKNDILSQLRIPPHILKITNPVYYTLKHSTLRLITQALVV